MSFRRLALTLAVVLSVLPGLGAADPPQGLERYEALRTPVGELWAYGTALHEREWVAERLEGWIERIEGSLGRRPPTPFTTILVPSFEELDGVVTALGGAPPNRDTRGIAFPSRRTIVVRTDWVPADVPVHPLSVTVRHELAHVAVHRESSRVPRWLDEGIASWLSRGRPPAREEAELSLLARSGRLYRAATLEHHFPDGHGATTLAYRQSALLVDCLVERYGSSVLPRLLDAFDDGHSTDVALERTIGMSLAELEEAFPLWFAARVSLLRSLVTFFADPWVVIALLACVASVTVAIRRRRAWRRLEDLEKLDETEGLEDFDANARASDDEARGGAGRDRPAMGEVGGADGADGSRSWDLDPSRGGFPFPPPSSDPFPGIFQPPLRKPGRR